MSQSWDPFWGELLRVFNEVAREVTSTVPGTASACGRTNASAFLFGAYLAFGRENDPSREDVVISVDCRIDGNSVFCTCDIARGDGYVLSDGPSLSILPERASCDPGGLAWLAEIATFLSSQTSLVSAELRSA